MDKRAFRSAIQRELEDNLLPFWRTQSLDPTGRGFVAEMANDGTVDRAAPLGLILVSRLLWTFSALYRELGADRDLELARLAFDVLESNFRDRDDGGYFWRIDAGGRPLDRVKKSYGHAFCIYALSEYFLASGDRTALRAAEAVDDLIVRHAFDSRFGGYFETRSSDWSPTTDFRLSDKDKNEAKSMNTHLHLLEALTNLYRARPNEGRAKRLEELIAVFRRHIINRTSSSRYLDHFFDEEWNLRSETHTFGHDIEAAWLLCETAEVLGHEQLVSETRRWATDLARTTLNQGVGADGGLAYEGRNTTVINPDRDWWCQAEAVVGFWHAYQLTGESEFADASLATWRFIDRFLVDRELGDWFSRVGPDGVVDTGEPKVSEWKGPYHNVRMCLEMMRRLGGANGVSG